METTVTGRHVEVTDELRAIVTRKIAKLARILNDNALSAQVVLVSEHQQCCAEVTLHARGDHVLHAEHEAGTWSQAVGGAVDKVDQQAHTLKGKWDDRRRGEGR